MSGNELQQLETYLHDWESQYLEMRGQLSFSDIYLLWLSVFRLSRRLINDYNQLMRSGTITCTTSAYTGDTQRLQSPR